MDKVKQILQSLRKYHFWILCVVAAIIGLIGWYMSTGKLEAEFAAGSAKIDGELKKLDEIKPDQPHDSWKDYAAKRSAEAEKSVMAAREKIYKQQKEEVFVWPKALGDDFLDAVAKLEGTNDQLKIDLRERYLDWVKHAVTPLAKTVDAASPDEALEPAPTTDGVPALPPEHKVAWAQIADIQRTFDWDQRPSTQLIKFAQEELWVYQALCDVIAKLNEGASGAYNASVKEISAMEIAYLAIDGASKSATKGRIQPIAAVAAAALDAAAAPAGEAAAAIVKPDVVNRGKKDASGVTAGDPAAAAPSNPDDVWKTYRYVNEKGEPITAASEAAPEYSMMPFRLLLRMDRRSVDKLLLACRNSKLPIEVQQVRINPSSTTGGGGGGGFAGGGGGAAGHGVRLEGGPAGGGGGAADTSGKGYDRVATVEVRGIVYIIQPEAKKPAAPEGDAPVDAAAPENAAAPVEPDAGAPAAAKSE